MYKRQQYLRIAVGKGPFSGPVGSAVVAAAFGLAGAAPDLSLIHIFSSVYAFAQSDCAVSVCSEASSHSNIAMILDASLLLSLIHI